jgi:N-methylhydantoinase B
VIPIDPVELAIFQSAVHSIAEEMGAALRRTALSPNIKERRDYSCAVFDGRGRVIAMGDHMPVHLGSMPMSVQAAVAAIAFAPGDIAILNDPYAGGTHLPDITMVLAGLSAWRRKAGLLRLESRSPRGCGRALRGLDGAGGRDLSGGHSNSSGAHCPRRAGGSRDARSDPAQCAHSEGSARATWMRRSVHAGWASGAFSRWRRSMASPGWRLIDELLDYSERLVRAELRTMPAGEFSAEDWLDDDGVTDEPRKIAVRLKPNPEAGGIHVDFAGSSPQVAGSVNAVRAITLSACFYVCAACSGRMRLRPQEFCGPLSLFTQPGSIVDALPPAAVAGGNVETSQRIVDVLLRALAKAIPERVPAASAGTMSNLTIGGVDPRSGEPFTYYETAAGGMGARPGMDGISGVQTHMTNSLNTPVEALEYAYPFRVRRYGYRDGSGGGGQFRGGDGLIREVEMLTPVRLTLLAERRRFRPYGLQGGEEGAGGAAWVVKAGSDEASKLPGKCSLELGAGQAVRIETPGGGGWGKR